MPITYVSPAAAEFFLIYCPLSDFHLLLKYIEAAGFLCRPRASARVIGLFRAFCVRAEKFSEVGVMGRERSLLFFPLFPRASVIISKSFGIFVRFVEESNL